MRDRRYVAARREVCAWLAEHPEIPWATLDGHDGQLRVLLGTRSTHGVVEIYEAGDPAPDRDAVRAKLDRSRRWIGGLASEEDGSCS